jgi:hypothetical protein
VLQRQKVPALLSLAHSANISTLELVTVSLRRTEAVDTVIVVIVVLTYWLSLRNFSTNGKPTCAR